MNDILMISTYAGLLTVVLGIVVYHITSMKHQIENVATKLSTSGGVSDDLKQEIYDLLTMSLEDTIGNMALPTWRDHLMGGLMPLIQSRFSQLDPRNLIKDGIESNEDHGEAKNQN